MPSLILHVSRDHEREVLVSLILMYQAPKLPRVEAEPECQQTVERVGAGGGREKAWVLLLAADDRSIYL